MPSFVRREFFTFLACGIPAHGFLRLRCGGCGREQILPFSCKGRGFCPSCGHRRMLDSQAHITDAILPDLPIRQFVFTFPFALRYRMAFDPALCADVRRVVMRALFGFYRDRATKKDNHLVPGPTGALVATQRFGTALNVNPHFHVLCFDGVFSAEAENTTDGFRFLGQPSKGELARLLAVCIARVERLLARRGLLDGDAPDDPGDHDPELAACLRQAVVDRERVHRKGARRSRPGTPPSVRLLVRERGYTLHADTAIPAYDHQRREMLVRYVLRPPFAASQVELTDGGKVSFRLAHAFDDGTTHIVWTKECFLARLAALVPRPRRHLLTYHGVLAPNHALRRHVVRHPTSARTAPARRQHEPADAISVPLARKRISHDQLLLRAYGFCFRRCDHCGGTKRVLAVITDPDTVAKILTAVGLDPDPPQRAPPAQLDWHVA